MLINLFYGSKLLMLTLLAEVDVEEAHGYNI